MFYMKRDTISIIISDIADVPISPSHFKSLNQSQGKGPSESNGKGEIVHS